MRLRGRDSGAATLEYLAAIAMVVAIFTVVSTSEMGSRITQSLSASVCRITQQDDCGQAPPAETDPGDQQPDNPGEGDSPDTPPGTDPDAEEETPEERQFREAAEELARIERELDRFEKDYANLDKEILQFLSELIGLDAAMRCIKEGDIMACLETAATLVPWGKALKILSKIPKAIKLFKKFKSIWDKVRDLRKKRKAADDKLKNTCKLFAGGPAGTSAGSGVSPDPPGLLAAGGRAPSGIVLVGNTANITRMDPGTVFRSGKYVFQIYSDDHGPPHGHLKGDGFDIQLGQNGKPLDPNIKLTREQQRIVDAHRSQIRSAIKKRMKEFRRNKCK